MSTPSWVASGALAALKVLFSAFSGPLKEVIAEAVKKLYSKALATDNPFDDFGVQVLAFLMSVDLAGVVAEVPAQGVEPKIMTEEVAKATLSPAEFEIYEKIVGGK